MLMNANGNSGGHFVCPYYGKCILNWFTQPLGRSLKVLMNEITDACSWLQIISVPRV